MGILNSKLRLGSQRKSKLVSINNIFFYTFQSLFLGIAFYNKIEMHVKSNGNSKNIRIPEKVSIIKLKHGQHILTGDINQKYPIRTSKTENFDEVTVVSGILCPLKHLNYYAVEV